MTDTLAWKSDPQGPREETCRSISASNKDMCELISNKSAVFELVVEVVDEGISTRCIFIVTIPEFQSLINEVRSKVLDDAACLVIS